MHYLIFLIKNQAKKISFVKQYFYEDQKNNIIYHYSILSKKRRHCFRRGLNSRPSDYETNALPTAPRKQINILIKV